jgi:hypothetical protein
MPLFVRTLLHESPLSPRPFPFYTHKDNDIGLFDMCPTGILRLKARNSLLCSCA